VEPAQNQYVDSLAEELAGIIGTDVESDEKVMSGMRKQFATRTGEWTPDVVPMTKSKRTGHPDSCSRAAAKNHR
jgi:hypothetical protein